MRGRFFVSGAAMRDASGMETITGKGPAAHLCAPHDSAKLTNIFAGVRSGRRSLSILLTRSADRTNRWHFSLGGGQGHTLEGGQLAGVLRRVADLVQDECTAGAIQ